MKAEVILDLMVYIMYAVNIHLILYTLADRGRADKWCVVLGALYAGAFLADNLAELPDTVMLILIFVLLYLSMLAAHGKHPVKTIYVTLLYISVDSLMGSLVSLLLGFFFPAGAIIKSAINLVLNITFYAVFRKFATRRADELRLSLSLLPKKVYVLILGYVFILGFFASGIYFFAHNVVSEAAKYKFIQLMVLIVSLISLIIILNMIVNGITRFYFEESSRLLDKQLDLQVKYYEKIEQMSMDMRKFRHDYNNHMTCLLSLLESEKNEEATEYLKSISEHPAMKKTSYRSGSPFADAILGDKAAAAEADGITVSFKGMISKRISAFDICTILSNALDNSIEACRKVNDTPKEITVRCLCKEGTQLISITNPAPPADPQLRTTKDEKELHGFGLINIRRTVEALGGTMETAPGSGKFVLDIMFPLAEAGKE